MGGGDAQRPVLRVNEPKKWVRAANGRTARPITLVVNICDCAYSIYMLSSVVHSQKGKSPSVFYLCVHELTNHETYTVYNKQTTFFHFCFVNHGTLML
jgi:hypothetical protein